MSGGRGLDDSLTPSPQIQLSPQPYDRLGADRVGPSAPRANASHSHSPRRRRRRRRIDLSSSEIDAGLNPRQRRQFEQQQASKLKKTPKKTPKKTLKKKQAKTPKRRRRERAPEGLGAGFMNIEKSLVQYLDRGGVGISASNQQMDQLIQKISNCEEQMDQLIRKVDHSRNEYEERDDLLGKAIDAQVEEISERGEESLERDNSIARRLNIINNNIIAVRQDMKGKGETTVEVGVGVGAGEVGPTAHSDGEVGPTAHSDDEVEKRNEETKAQTKPQTKPQPPIERRTLRSTSRRA